MKMHATYTCPICLLSLDVELDTSIPTLVGLTGRISNLEEHARTFVFAHQYSHSHAPEIRSIPDGNEEGTAADYPSQETSGTSRP